MFVDVLLFPIALEVVSFLLLPLLATTEEVSVFPLALTEPVLLLMLLFAEMSLLFTHSPFSLTLCPRC